MLHEITALVSKADELPAFPHVSGQDSLSSQLHIVFDHERDLGEIVLDRIFEPKGEIGPSFAQFSLPVPDESYANDSLGDALEPTVVVYDPILVRFDDQEVHFRSNAPIPRLPYLL